MVAKTKKHILDGRGDTVLRLIHKGISKTQVARLMGVSIFTIYQFLEKNEDNFMNLM